jgi:hypothetical protein
LGVDLVSLLMLEGPTVEHARGLSSTGVGTAETQVRRERKRKRRTWCWKEKDMVTAGAKYFGSAENNNSLEVLDESIFLAQRE